MNSLSSEKFQHPALHKIVSGLRIALRSEVILIRYNNEFIFCGGQKLQSLNDAGNELQLFQ